MFVCPVPGANVDHVAGAVSGRIPWREGRFPFYPQNRGGGDGELWGTVSILFLVTLAHWPRHH